MTRSASTSPSRPALWVASLLALALLAAPSCRCGEEPPVDPEPKPQCAADCTSAQVARVNECLAECPDGDEFCTGGCCRIFDQDTSPGTCPASRACVPACK